MEYFWAIIALIPLPFIMAFWYWGVYKPSNELFDERRKRQQRIDEKLNKVLDKLGEKYE